MRHLLAREQLVPRPRPQVFAFFADAANLERLTPPTLRFSIRTSPPINMQTGATIDYRLSLFGVRFRWRTIIELFEPESRFVDVQAAGPYALWRHLHEFIEAPGGTRIRDCVEYELPLGPLGELAHALFVRRQLEHIFDYRRRVIEEVFAPPQPAAAPR
jgi:ligand-binding SRPBCC domain-containing protein